MNDKGHRLTTAQKPDNQKSRNSKVFRMSLTNFRMKKPAEADSGLTTPTQGNVRTPRGKLTLDTKNQNILQTQSIKTDPGRKTTTGFFNHTKPAHFKMLKYPTSGGDQSGPTKTLTRSDLIAIRASPNAFRKLGGGTMGITSKNFMKIPISDLYNVPTSTKSAQKLVEQDAYGFEEARDKHFLDGSSGGTEEEIPADKSSKKKRNGTFSTLESSSQTTKMKNSSLSSLQHLNSYGDSDKYKFAMDYGENASPRQSATAVGGQRKVMAKGSVNGMKQAKKVSQPQMQHSNSKTVYKFNEAMDKAKHFNNQMIKQQQFERDDEEEEHDFAEMYELLMNK